MSIQTIIPHNKLYFNVKLLQLGPHSLFGKRPVLKINIYGPMCVVLEQSKGKDSVYIVINKEIGLT